MRQINETERKLISLMLDIEDSESFVLLGMLFLKTEKMKEDAVEYLENHSVKTM